MRRRVVLAGLLAGLAAIVVAALAVVTVPRRVQPPAQTSTVADHGTAPRLDGPSGFAVAVSDVRVLSGTGRVIMALTFRNTSSNQQRADPGDFQLRTPSGTTVRPAFDASCPSWNRADLHAGGGSAQSPRDSDAYQVGPVFGPVPLCFSLPDPVSCGLALIWDPDLGLLGTAVSIPLH